jgi:hypothetical protein
LAQLAQHKVPLASEVRHFECDYRLAIDVRRQLGEFRLWMLAFHGRQHAMRGDQVAAGRDEIRKACKCTRDDQREALCRLPRFDAAFAKLSPYSARTGFLKFLQKIRSS